MTLRMTWPWWALAVVLGPLLALTVVQAVRAGRTVRAARAGGAPPAADDTSALAWVRRAAMVLAVGVIGLCPATTTTLPGALGVDVDMFFVVDRTGSMAAEDGDSTDEHADPGAAQPSPAALSTGAPASAASSQAGAAVTRLDVAKHDVVSLVADIPGARYSIITFDSQASRQLPLTTDARAVSTWAQTVRQEITAYSSGSLTDRPLDALTSALQGAADRDPSHVRLVFYLSDGEQTVGGEPASFADLAPLVDGGAVLGYGTAAGARMRSYDGALALDPDAAYIQDGAGDAVSRLDEATLQTLADQLGVPYVHRTAPDATAPLVADIDPEQIAADSRRDVTTFTNVTWPFAALLVLLLAGEVWGTTPRARRRRPRTVNR